MIRGKSAYLYGFPEGNREKEGRELGEECVLASSVGGVPWCKYYAEPFFYRPAPGHRQS